MDKILLKIIEGVSDDMKEIKQEIKNMHNEQKDISYKCEIKCVNKYVQIADFGNYFKENYKKYSNEKFNNANNKMTLIKNLVQILTTIAPYLIMLMGFYTISQKM
ncbi:MAG: hypothetical protein FWG98_06725 [Candidatus Cloacimonetes bacterium]|nr:hypothetical protein [Candidatus Cloacimonadota bacterium]